MTSRMGKDRTRTVVDVARYDEISLHSFHKSSHDVSYLSSFGRSLLSLVLELWLWFGLYIPLNRNQMREKGC